MAITLVVLYHVALFGFTLPYRVDRFGWIGVDLFFVLSGYLIGGQLLAALARGAPIHLARFYWRRALRILPAFLVVIAIYLVLPQLREFSTMPPVWKFLSFTQNFGLRGGTAFSHAWSLCIEAQFYLVLPLVLVGLARAHKARIALPIALLIGGIAIRAVFAHANVASAQPSFAYWQKFIYYPTYARLDPLIVGVSLAAVRVSQPRWWTGLTNASQWLWAPGILAIAFALYLTNDALSVVTCALSFPLIACGFGGLLVCAVSPKLPLSRVAVPGATFLASIAYSVYLSHKLAIHFVEGICDAHAIPRASVSGYLLVLAVITVVGAALYFAVERPFLIIRQRR
ncbi:MAG: acyltransferase [Verrucomicrobiota bacterium]|nr:acyltransferase [Verrucomicrobiota bacterium]